MEGTSPSEWKPVRLFIDIRKDICSKIKLMKDDIHKLYCLKLTKTQVADYFNERRSSDPNASAEELTESIIKLNLNPPQICANPKSKPCIPLGDPPQRNLFDSLPDDILLLILSLLRPTPDGMWPTSQYHAADLVKMQYICARFRSRDIITHQNVCETMAQRECAALDITALGSCTNWLERLWRACPWHGDTRYPSILHCFLFVPKGGPANPEQILRKYYGGHPDSQIFNWFYAWNLGLITCTDGDARATVSAQGATKAVRELAPGDLVRTGQGHWKSVTRVFRDSMAEQGTCALVELQGVFLTPTHPVFLRGAWHHPEELAEPHMRRVSSLYNLELARDATGDHSVLLNDLAVATLGQYTGPRLAAKDPSLDRDYGRGYWTGAKRREMYAKQGWTLEE